MAGAAGGGGRGGEAGCGRCEGREAAEGVSGVCCPASWSNPLHTRTPRFHPHTFPCVQLLSGRRQRQWWCPASWSASWLDCRASGGKRRPAGGRWGAGVCGGERRPAGKEWGLTRKVLRTALRVYRLRVGVEYRPQVCRSQRAPTPPPCHTFPSNGV